MGMYTGLRFKGIIKPEYRTIIKGIHNDNLTWEESGLIDDFIYDGRADFIPYGALCYMPKSWKYDDYIPHEFNEETGYWSFQCSLKNYDNTIEKFLDMIGDMVDSVEFCEYYYEEWDYSSKYELKHGTMIKTDDEFIEYW